MELFNKYHDEENKKGIVGLVSDGKWDYAGLLTSKLNHTLYDEKRTVDHDGDGGSESLALGALRRRADSEIHGGWEKYTGNPVLGGQYGTCFDICVLREHGLYRMWVSWRPKKSIALTESKDGIHWPAPEIVLPPEPRTGWEETSIAP